MTAPLTLALVGLISVAGSVVQAANIKGTNKRPIFFITYTSRYSKVLKIIQH